MKPQFDRSAACIRFWKAEVAKARLHAYEIAESGADTGQAAAILEIAEKHLREALALPHTPQNSPISPHA